MHNSDGRVFTWGIFSFLLSYLLFMGGYWVVDCGWIVGGYSGRIVDSGYAYLMLTTHQKKFQLNRLINV